MQLTIKQSNDIVDIDVWKWCLNLFRGPQKQKCIRSRSYGIEVFRMADYWVELGKKEALIQIVRDKGKGILSYSLEELCVKVSILEFGQSPVLVIYNFDTSQLGRIIDRLPGINPNVFSQDIVLIPCANLVQAKKIKTLLPTEMAYTLIVDKGIGYLR